MMNPYLALVKRDMKISLGRGSEGMTTLFFFVVTASLFAMALGGEQALVRRAAPGIIWVSAMLASLLSLETLYHRDQEDGTFDLVLLSPVSPLGVALAKMLAHWVISGLTLVLASVVVAQMLFVPEAALGVVIPSLLLGTFYMSLLGGMGAVLTFGTRRPGLLLALLIMPLYIPMLILGMLAAEAALADLPSRAYLLLQLALVLAALPLTAWVAALFLGINLRS